MLASTTADGLKLWTRDRTRGVDRRSRGYRRWAARRAELVAELGRAPSPADAVLLDQLTDLLIDADLWRARRHAGEPVGARASERAAVATECRRLAKMLGLGLNGRAAAEPKTATDFARERGIRR